MNFLSFTCVVLIIIPGWVWLFLASYWLTKKYNKYEDAIVHAVIHQHPIGDEFIPPMSNPMGYESLMRTAKYLISVIDRG